MVTQSPSRATARQTPGKVSGIPLVAGIDSSTQSCKVVVVRADDGTVLREGTAPHPPGTILDPEVWWKAMLLAIQRAGGLHDVAALAVAGQQHTPIFIGREGTPVCASPLWNDTGSYPHVRALNDELGTDTWIRRTGLPITLSDTVAKLRWLRDEDPQSARATVAVAVVHDWLTWRLQGGGHGNTDFSLLATDRSEASGTGYWSGDTGAYCLDLFEHAFGRKAQLPRLYGPTDRVGVTAAGIPGVPPGIVLAPGCGDNAAAALALGLRVGDAVMSIGTSGVVYARSEAPVHDYRRVVCSYADATGNHLPLAATLNAARNLDAVTTMLGCSYEQLSRLALTAPAGAEGLTLLPYFEGERTPDLPTARASLHGASLTNFTPANLARAAIEGTLASQMTLVDGLQSCDVPVERIFLIGGAAQSPAVQHVLTELTTTPILVPEPGQYVSCGAALQSFAAVTGAFANWPAVVHQLPANKPQPVILDQHEAAKRALGYEDATRGEGNRPEMAEEDSHVE